MTRHHRAVAARPMSVVYDWPRFYDAQGATADQIAAETPASAQWLADGSIVYGCAHAAAMDVQVWRAVVNAPVASGSSEPGSTTPGRATEAHMVGTSAELAGVPEPQDGALYHVVAVPAANDFPSADTAIATVRSSPPVRWHAPTVAARIVTPANLSVALHWFNGDLAIDADWRLALGGGGTLEGRTDHALGLLTATIPPGVTSATLYLRRNGRDLWTTPLTFTR